MENFTIFGIRSILEAISSDKQIDKVWLLKGTQSKLFEQLLHQLRARNIPFSFVPVERLSRFSEKNHQGAVARIGAIKTHEMEPLIEHILQSKKNPIFLLLDGITDVRNYGAILRSAAASGIDAVFVPAGGSAPLNGDTIKTSAGGAFKIPISKVNHLKDVVYYLKAQDVQTFALTEKASGLIYQSNLTGPTALIFGSEDVGISSGLLKIVDAKAKLPIHNEIDSLNVSVACGIVFYEALRQRL
jgi:23S rRNA (guanosine2251-2'-O)-methyltransferase